MNNEELMSAIDEELDNCIRKFRNAVYGEEVRAFITEYEELMLKKSDLVVQGFIKKDHEEHQKSQTIRRSKSSFVKDNKRKMTHLMILQIAQGISIIILAMSVIMR